MAHGPWYGWEGGWRSLGSGCHLPFGAGAAEEVTNEHFSLFIFGGRGFAVLVNHRPLNGHATQGRTLLYTETRL